MAKWFKSYSSIFLIVILGLSLRLIYLREWFHFEFDEEVIAWKLRPFLQEGRPFLIGGGTPFGFHLGPAFYYLSAIPLFFSSLDPIGWGAAAAILGMATIFLIWLAGKNLYGRRVGLIAALFWATSFTAVMSDRHWWPLVLDPLLALVVILAFYYIEKVRILPNGRMRTFHWWMILGLTLAFGWQADLTVLPLFLAAGVVAVLNFRRQWKGILVALGILLMSFLPLVLFELRHPGTNLGRLLQYGLNGGFNLERLHLNNFNPVFILSGLSRLLLPITHLDGNLLKFYTWCREIADGRVTGQPWWAVGWTVILLIIPFVSEKFAKLHDRREVSQTSRPVADRILRVIIISSVAGILVFKLFGGNLYDFYLAVLYPVVMILAARAIDLAPEGHGFLSVEGDAGSKAFGAGFRSAPQSMGSRRLLSAELHFIWRKRGMLAGGVIVAVIVGLNLTTIFKAYHPQSLAVKQAAAAWAAEQLNGREFELDSLSGCSRYNGVRYLFFLKNMEPVKSFVDQDLSWLYPSYDEKSRPEYLVTFATPDDLNEEDRQRYNYLVSQAEARREFGDLEVIITKK